jgi:hypothetical protein
VSRGKVLANLRLASRKGDRAALELALGEMRTLALSPRYWEKYLVLLRSPLARLADLLAIKQGERIARLKGWKLPKPVPEKAAERAKPSERPRPRRARTPVTGATQASLFE